MEYGFLSQAFGDLTPNLRNLAKDWTFYKMNPAMGSSWTSGSLYAHQVGVPAIYPERSIFSHMTSSKLIGLGNILKKAKYKSKYIMPLKEFEGMDNFLQAYDIEAISEKNSIGNYQEASWGMLDFDIFNEAKLQINEFLKNKNAPFALFISTVSTHPPNGIYDMRMQKYIPNKINNFEFTIASVDYLLNDFISFLNKNGIMQNTSIYIFPDHLLMSGPKETTDKINLKARYLYMLTNVNKDKLGKSTNESIYQIELPRMIINGADIKTNATFLSDFIKGDIGKFIATNKEKISSLNFSAIEKTNFYEGIHIELKDSNLSIKTKNFKKKIDRKIYPEDDIIIDIIFTPSMTYLENYIVTKENAFINKDENVHLLIFIKNSKIIKSYLGNKKNIGIYKNSDKSYNNEEIITLQNSIKLSNEKTEIYQNLKTDHKTILARSSEKITSKKYPSYIKYKNKSYSLSRGLNLLSIDKNGKIKFENFDTFGSQKEAIDFINAITNTINNNYNWILVSDDALNPNWYNFQKSLYDLGFKILPKMGWRVAYIAYSKEDKIIYEDYSSTTLSYAISLE